MNVFLQQIGNFFLCLSFFLKFFCWIFFIFRYYFALNSGKENENYLQNRIISRGGRSSIYSSLFFRAEEFSAKENGKFYGKIENFVKDEFKFDPENLLILSGLFFFTICFFFSIFFWQFFTIWLFFYHFFDNFWQFVSFFQLFLTIFHNLVFFYPFFDNLEQTVHVAVRVAHSFNFFKQHKPQKSSQWEEFTNNRESQSQIPQIFHFQKDYRTILTRFEQIWFSKFQNPQWVQHLSMELEFWVLKTSEKNLSSWMVSFFLSCFFVEIFCLKIGNEKGCVNRNEDSLDMKTLIPEIMPNSGIFRFAWYEKVCSQIFFSFPNL